MARSRPAAGARPLRDPPERARFRAAARGRVHRHRRKLDRFGSADRLAGIAGVAPVPKGSGKISGNCRSATRYDRRLLRTRFLAAQNAAGYCPESRSYYDPKRAEWKNHKQAHGWGRSEAEAPARTRATARAQRGPNVRRGAGHLPGGAGVWPFLLPPAGRGAGFQRPRSESRPTGP
ncbi:transposase [Sinomonas atrocyanea]|uniref:transposase n=1 Tax=Sinomonas atrocyanea TaxID=37927 RepID=UPI00358F09EF